MDGVLIGTILIHSHIGFQYVSPYFPSNVSTQVPFTNELTSDQLNRSVIIDYLPNWRVPRTRRLFNWGLNLALLVVGWGWYEFETNDVGLTAAIGRIWSAGKKPQDE